MSESHKQKAHPPGPPRPLVASMSLKTRLQIYIIVAMVSVVSALSVLYLQRLSWREFDSIGERATRSAQQVQSYLSARIREIMAGQPPGEQLELHEYKRLWAEYIEKDEALHSFMVGTLSNSNTIVEILVADSSTGRILASTVPARAGAFAEPLPDFAEWSRLSHWRKLSEIFKERRDYQVSLPLGITGQPPFFRLEVILSSVFLRGLIFPEVRDLMLIFMAALLISMLLAVVISNLALRPLHRISQTIDQIARGELRQPAGASEPAARELAAVQSKLNLLGQQYHGARQDAIQLRSNVERLLEKLEEVVFLFDRDDRLVMSGRASERLFGRGRWEMVGRSLSEIFPASTPLGAAVRNAIDMRQPVRDLSVTLERSGGQGTRVLVNIEPLEGFPGHERIGTLITLRDAETRRQIQSQLDVSARLAAISRLTGGVAHEIKNPLQSITVHLEVLKSKLADQYDEIGPAIETIAREIQRLDRVVKTFLDFTRPIDLRMRELELVPLTREVVKLVSPSAARQGVSIEFIARAGDLFMHGDRDLVQQAILNVVVNGIEAMKEGGRLEVACDRSGEDCQITISDQGAGIPEEIRDRIFNLYYSTKGKGSGIGLAMTFRVVQLHNGTIDFTSQPGKGTTFRLRFPAVIREPAAAAGEAGSVDARV